MGINRKLQTKWLKKLRDIKISKGDILIQPSLFETCYKRLDTIEVDGKTIEFNGVFDNYQIHPLGERFYLSPGGRVKPKRRIKEHNLLPALRHSLRVLSMGGTTVYRFHRGALIALLAIGALAVIKIIQTLP